MKTVGEPAVTVPKTRKEYSDADWKSIEKNFRAKKILVCGNGPDEYNKISACQSAKEIWEVLQTTHERTTQVKQSKINMLTTEYELFRMKNDESIQDMHTRFASIINELHSLGEIIPRNKLVRKILSVLPSSWESKEDLGRVKNDLEKSLKWTWSSDTITSMFTSNGGNMKNLVPTENQVFVEKVTTAKEPAFSIKKRVLPTWTKKMKESNQKWYMDSGCSKHMTGSIDDLLSLKALQGGSVSFGNSKKGYILGVGRIGKTLTHSIENVYYVNGLKYILLSVSQIFDKGNKVEFLSKPCTVTNLVTGEVVLLAKKFKNIYVTDFESLHNGDLTCLSAIDDDAELWHRRLGHESFSLLNKLVKKDLVRGLLESRFKGHKVCDACVRGKQVKSSFKPKKRIQVKMSHNVVSIRSDHGIEFDNAKSDECCAENDISHNYLAPRTPPTKWYCGEEKYDS
ncbi:uncharacterized protein LOC142175290 [Nicotiana tabacum]|uniref:Uncharacterized protein LOC142175290 n=1 Tax=Nicotiana tabacum TaxID=4097 RepID=A0AC58TL74_TOBAC